MTVTTKPHSNSPKHTVIFNPTAEIVALANKQVASIAKYFANSNTVTVANNSMYLFNELIKRANTVISAEEAAERAEIEKMYADFGQRRADGTAY